MALFQPRADPIAYVDHELRKAVERLHLTHAMCRDDHAQRLHIDELLEQRLCLRDARIIQEFESQLTQL